MKSSHKMYFIRTNVEKSINKSYFISMDIAELLFLWRLVKMKKVTVSTLLKRRNNGEKLVMSTAYDAIQSRLCMAAGIDFMLVGDSVAMTQLGFDNTLPVTMEQMLSHTAAVRRGAPEAFVVFDMPFMSYQTSDAEAMKNAGTALKSTGADAVKLEGGAEYAGLVRKMTGAGIPVMGHIGLMPQRVQVCGGYKIVGRDAESADKVLEDALALQDAGVFAIVLECIPEELGRKVTEALCIPTIGIGSGKYCSGQVQVITDLLGMMEFKPKHAKRYAEIGQLMTEALKNYADEVKSGTFPTPENTFQ